MSRINATFERLASQGKTAFVSYVMAGHPSEEKSLEVLNGLAEAGVDIIELGTPFTDPMADGSTIQVAGQIALENGMTLTKTLAMVTAFRKSNDTTPIILMGYYNPIYIYGVERFLEDAKAAGIDGLIIVDLPPEEDDELCIPAGRVGIDFIRLLTPTTDEQRLPNVLPNTSGFLYYVAITGITGSASASPETVGREVARIKSKTDLPVCVGFGIKNPQDAAAMAKVADGVVVGSAIVSKMASDASASEVLSFVSDLAEGAHSA